MGRGKSPRDVLLGAQSIRDNRIVLPILSAEERERVDRFHVAHSELTDPDDIEAFDEITEILYDTQGGSRHKKYFVRIKEIMEIRSLLEQETTNHLIKNGRGCEEQSRLKRRQSAYTKALETLL